MFIQKDKLSKMKVMKLLGRQDHGNISEVCDFLANSDLIKICLVERNGGRPEKFYKITKKGVVYLIENSTTPKEFWNSIITLVYYQNESYGWQEILELFDIYLKKYLKWYLKKGYYSFQLDEFDLTCKNWFEKMIFPSGKISVAQKVLEVLAIRPGITLDQIAEAMHGSVEKIEPIIKMYTTIPHKPVRVDVDGHHDSPFYDTREWRFQIHWAITPSKSTNGLTFSLSLFGILMVFYIILKNHAGKLPQGLLYSHGLQQYFNIIAKNHKTKIPLILGNWPLLDSKLSDYSCLNFRTILDKDIREKSFRYSVRDNGNKELYIGMKETILASQRQLMDLQIAGMNAIFNFYPKEEYTIQPTSAFNTADIWSKKSLAFQLLLYLTSLIRPTDYDSESLTSTVQDELNILGLKVDEEIRSLYDVGHLERNLSYEISFIYLLSLRSDEVFTYHNNLPVPFEQILNDILEVDENIASFFNEHLATINRYYKEIRQIIETICNRRIHFKTN